MDLIESIKNFVGVETDEIKEDISIEDSDELLAKKVDLRVKEADFIRKPKLKEWSKNLRFFDGDHWQVADAQLPSYKADIFINKVFSSLRSLVAYETDEKPDPVVEAIADNNSPDIEQITEAAKKVEGMLDFAWDLRNVPITLTEIYYDRYIFDDGFGMYFWNAVDDDVDFEQIKPQEILRSPGSTSIDDAEYIIIEKWRNKKYFQDNFPDEVDNIDFSEMEDNEQTTDEKAKRKCLAKVHYYFQDDIWIFKCGDIILKKIKNPFWEWRTGEEQTEEAISRVGFEPPNFKTIKNFLTKPEKPIIQFKGYHLGGEFDSRSLMKQIIKLNIALNKRKCQIQDIIDGTGSPQWVIDPSVPKVDVERITSKPGLKIRVNPNLIRKEPAASPPQAIFDDMLHTEKSFDDVVGQHEISRGATTRKRITKGEAEIVKESDITPIRLIMRNDEAAITRLLKGWLQLMKLFYDQPHFIGKVSDKAPVMYGNFLTREDIPDRMYLAVKNGSTMPVSREIKREQYVRDFQMGALSLIDYLEFMDYPNPQKLAQNIMAQQQGQIGTQLGVEQAQAQIQAQAQPQPQPQPMQ